MDETRAWLERCTGREIRAWTPLPGGAGARTYARVHFRDDRTAILMFAHPEDPEILPPALRAERDDLPFVDVARYLAEQGVPVPEILGVEPRRRWILLEDLGSQHVADLEGEVLAERLREACALLARIHALPRSDARPFRRRFDRAWIRFELDTFVRHGLETEDARALAPALEALAAAIADLPHVLCLRDYQCRNLLVDPEGRLRVIDFQDALLAPAELDLAALVWDSYLDLDDAQRRTLLDVYAAARGVRPEREALALLIVQRKCKDWGRFQRLARSEGEARWGLPRRRAREAVLAQLPCLPPGHAALARGLERALGEAAA